MAASRVLEALSTFDVKVVGSKDRVGDERRQKLLDGLHFSKRFIISYNLVLVGLLACFTIWHWVIQPLRRRRRRTLTQVAENHTKNDLKSAVKAAERETATASSSGSSSSSVSSHEQTPLLDRPRQTGRRSTTAFIYHRIRSWMIYQPANIPFINKTLPSNATTIAVLLFLGLNVFYVFFKVPLSIMTMFVFSDRVGLVFVANLPLLYLFAAKNQPIKVLTGYSYESLNLIHRRLGELMCLLALLHAVGMTVVWYTILYPQISFWQFLSIKIIWLGLLTFVSYELLYLTSLGSFRQRFYELFLGLHVLLQAAALILLWFHHSGSRPYVGMALAILVIDRLVFRLALKTRTLAAGLSVLEDGETVLLSSNWQIASQPAWRRMLNTNIKSGWKPTEHIFLTIPALAHKHYVQAHPFTIASAAPSAPNAHAWLGLVIRAHDGFSRDLLRYAQSHRSVKARIDGPYGSLHALEMLEDSDIAVVVAGGSGIAVAFPVVWSLLHPRDEDSPRKRSVHLIWIVHDASHIDWIGQERFDELRGLGLHVVIPSPTMKAGRPDVARLVESAVTSHYQNGSKVGVMVSGPDGMNRSARNACADLVRTGLDVSVAVEKFGW